MPIYGFNKQEDAEELLLLLKERRGRGPVGQIGKANPAAPVHHEEGEEFVNDSGETIPALSIACLDTFGSHLIYGAPKVVKPGTTFRNQLIITGQTAVADGTRGFFRHQVYYKVKYDSGTPARGEGWGVKPGQWTISKGFPGCTIVGVVDSTNKIARVSLESPITQLYCKCTSAMTGGAVATGNKYNIMCGAADSETDSGFSSVPDVFIPGGDIAVDDFLWLTWTNNSWYGGKIC